MTDISTRARTSVMVRRENERTEELLPHTSSSTMLNQVIAFLEHQINLESRRNIV